MVNFRFHLVSIIAVFLALALGIGMGVTVIDRATVELLENRLDRVQEEVNAANQRSDRLQSDVGRAGAYQEQTEPYLLRGALDRVPVVIVGVRGVDEGPIRPLVDMLGDAGAAVQGQLWITNEARLDDARAVTALQQALEAPLAGQAELRQALAVRLSAVVAGALEPAALRPLVDAGFLEWRGSEGRSDVASALFGEARYVLVSSAAAELPNDQLVLPLVRLVADQPARRLVAVEAGRDPDDRTSGERAVFVGPLRDDAEIGGRISTVDHVESPLGRVATVLALSQLAAGRTGDYGVAGGTDGLIPRRAE